VNDPKKFVPTFWLEGGGEVVVEVIVMKVEVEAEVAACDTFGHSCRRARNSASTLPVHQQSALAERCIWGGAKLGGSGSSGWS
jgi:hypothetical protein